MTLAGAVIFEVEDDDVTALHPKSTMDDMKGKRVIISSSWLFVETLPGKASRKPVHALYKVQ